MTDMTDKENEELRAYRVVANDLLLEWCEDPEIDEVLMCIAMAEHCLAACVFGEEGMKPEHMIHILGTMIRNAAALENAANEVTIN